MRTTVATPSTETTLIMKRTFAVPRSRVFEAWTKPEMLKQWFTASAEYVSPLAEIDLRIGGRFRMAMKHITKGTTHTATGVYREIRPPDRLVFTWEWEGETENGQSLVTIELRDAGASTEMIFKQEFFPSKKIRDDHEKGWTGCFGNLTRLVQQ
ncbi:MAG: Activator of Hsp90 ATPase 1 family protein [Bacteroidetes bacterium]|nr:Activator of Hsp90 ATPase 1 family protein [Bacteroidota bacterium]